MVQSRNVPSSSLLAWPSQPPDVKALAWGATRAALAASREAKPRTLNDFMAPSPLIGSFKHISMWRAAGGRRRRCRKSPHHDNFSIAVNARVDRLEALRQRDVGIGALLQDDGRALSDPAAGPGQLKRPRAETFAVGRVEKDEVE